MAIQPQLLEILACPICKEEVRPVPLSEARRVIVRDKFRDKMRGEELVVEQGLKCVKCHRVYPIVSDNQLTGYQPRFVTETELSAVDALLAEKSGWDSAARAAASQPLFSASSASTADNSVSVTNRGW